MQLIKRLSPAIPILLSLTVTTSGSHSAARILLPQTHPEREPEFRGPQSDRPEYFAQQNVSKGRQAQDERTSLSREHKATDAIQLKQQSANEKAAVFDIGGVLVEVNNNQQILSKIGWWNILNYTLHFNNPFKLRDHLLKIAFDILYKMRGEKPDPASFPPGHPMAAGFPMPSIMVDWQLGKISSAAVLAEAKTFIKRLAKQGYFKNSLDEEMTHIYFGCIFDASQRVPFTEPIKEGWDLVKKYKDDGYRIYLLSNMDPDTMPLTKAKLPKLFAMVDGIVYSSAEHIMKPQPEFFKILLDRYHLQPEQCIFFDDQKENIAAAQKLGFETFLCSRESMKTLLTQLEEKPDQASTVVVAATYV